MGGGAGRRAGGDRHGAGWARRPAPRLAAPRGSPLDQRPQGIVAAGGVGVLGVRRTGSGSVSASFRPPLPSPPIASVGMRPGHGRGGAQRRRLCAPSSGGGVACAAKAPGTRQRDRSRGTPARRRCSRRRTQSRSPRARPRRRAQRRREQPPPNAGVGSANVGASPRTSEQAPTAARALPLRARPRRERRRLGRMRRVNLFRGRDGRLCRRGCGGLGPEASAPDRRRRAEASAAPSRAPARRRLRLPAGSRRRPDRSARARERRATRAARRAAAAGGVP